jgi:hypothetical protein
MQAIDLDLARWPKRRWIFAVVVVLAAQLGPLLWLSLQNPLSRVAISPTPRISMTMTPGPARSSPQFDPIDDPMLFARAHPHGFSSAAWGPPGLKVEIVPKAKVLPALAFSDAGDLIQFSSLGADRLSYVPNHRFEPPLDAPALLGKGPARESFLRLEGDLARRELLSRPQLPQQTFNDALQGTVIEAAVNSDGFVMSARVVSGSGAKQADLDGLSISKRLRFTPSGVDSGLTWGRLVFEWFGVAAPEANAGVKK